MAPKRRASLPISPAAKRSIWSYSPTALCALAQATRSSIARQLGQVEIPPFETIDQFGTSPTAFLPLASRYQASKPEQTISRAIEVTPPDDVPGTGTVSPTTQSQPIEIEDTNILPVVVQTAGAHESTDLIDGAGALPRAVGTEHLNPLEGQSQQSHFIFQQCYNLEISHPQFTGICSYLCALLLLGYRIRRTDFDDFIGHYPQYEMCLPQLMVEQLHSRRTDLVSYHEWFLRNRGSITFDRHVLTEDILRRIWAQHPYSFLKQRLRMDMIVKSRRHRIGGPSEEQGNDRRVSASNGCLEGVETGRSS